MTPAQTAGLLEGHMHGTGFAAPATTETVFGDVPVGALAANLVEQLTADAIIAGCGNGDYCPTAALTQAQMAVFCYGPSTIRVTAHQLQRGSF